MDAVKRVLATASSKEVRARGVSPEASEWWLKLPKEAKEEYIDSHPNSKYADQAIAESDEAESNGTPQKQTVSPEQKKEVADSMRKSSSKIADTLRKTFPRINAAGSALKHLVSGKELDHEHKEVLYEFGGLALKTALGHMTGAHEAMVVGRLGITAIKHGIDHFSEKKKAQPNKDDVENFVDSVADGLEHAKEVDVPADHKAEKSSYRQAIGQHIKDSAHHVAEVLHKSFPHIKPAVQGLNYLASGKKLDEPHKKALKGLGKIALATSIAALPGGLAAHLAAGVGTVAVKHAFKAIQGAKHSGGNLLHHFIEEIGEGLEEALIASGSEGHEGGGHE